MDKRIKWGIIVLVGAGLTALGIHTFTPGENKELAAAEEKLAFINKKLDNPGFVNKAPEKVVQQNRDEAAKLTEKIANLRSSLENLGK